MSTARRLAADVLHWREDFDRAAFLARVWQRKPFLIRQAWRAWGNLLEPDELAGLACADNVEARLVLRNGRRWSVEHGPFAAQRFAKLPARHWTLLVQAVDQHRPEVAALRDAFRFLPDWRSDDVMVSYAVDGGGVGAHFDQYDVFLLQGLGQRRWQVGPRCDSDTTLLPHDELRLLRDFEVEHDWLLDAGDMLYLPPRYAHRGVAVGDECMTYSIGFRAPSRAELLGHWADAAIDGLNEDDRYTDGRLSAAAKPGEIDDATLGRLRGMVESALADRAVFSDWFGRYVTARKYPEPTGGPARATNSTRLVARLARGACLVRHASSRYAYMRRGRGLNLYVDGGSLACKGAAARLAERLCNERGCRLGASDLRAKAALDLAVELFNRGVLVFDDAW